tara:strand:- start:219 stop:692 length:474 start_codon:yes stop_codon:yes gene_type:complete
MDNFYESKPLAVFSVDTQIQVDYLIKLGGEIDEKLRSYTGVVHNFDDTYGRFWLWLLGAYEVTRTLSQHADSLDPNFAQKLKELKQYLAEVRMPFAKQEYRGKGGKIGNDLCVVSIQQDMKFIIDGKPYFARSVIDRVVAFFLSVDLKHLGVLTSNQ